MLGVAACAALVCAARGRPVELRQCDFDQGTYRITQPGTYKLMENVDFAPHPQNDYWVPHSLRGQYPYEQYYLGFFAAVTVECDDVTIDLNGHTLQQGKEFYLLQRFFNVIELNDRVFVDNEGVSSLNYQKGDSVVPGAGKASRLVTVKRVVVKDGVLGRSSHAGIHGNGAKDVTIKNVEVRGFEVAGVQCNGCADVSVRRCVVGPTARDVPVVATFAHARFIDLYVNDLIPHGFARDKMSAALLPLLSEPISFADRETATTVQAVFARLRRGLQLFRDHYMGRTGTLCSEDQALLAEAVKVFQNPTGLTDGGVVYGLFFNKLGTSDTDDNHYQAGVEARNIDVSDTQLVGLDANPLEVPHLMTQSGHRVQGPARDVLRVFEMVSDGARSLLDTRYAGNFVGDSYFAMWQLSNAFYNARVFQSECGNFGSNATMPYNLAGYPNAARTTCSAAGTSQDAGLTGRQVTMLQKRYFGGLTMSQRVFNWATQPGATLDAVLKTPVFADSRRQSRHMIRCDQDTMFHSSHGVIGIKVVQAKHVQLNRVTLRHFKNTGDLSHWVCRRGAWELESGESIEPVHSPLKGDGASVRGIQVLRSEDVVLRHVEIADMNSHEGRVTGIEVVGDTNDRSEHKDDVGIELKHCDVRKLKSGGGPTTGATPLKAVGTSVDTGGLTVGKPTELGAGLGNVRTMVYYEMDSVVPSTPEGFPDYVLTSQPASLQALYDLSSYNTEAKAKGLRSRMLAHFRSYFGLRFADDADETPLLSPIAVLDDTGAPTDSTLRLGQLARFADYHVRSVCTSSGDNAQQTCLDDQPNARVHDWFFGVSVGPSGLVVRGVFGGDEGQFVSVGAGIVGGLYVLDNLDLPGVSTGRMVEVTYFSLCPITTEPAVDSRNTLSAPVNCALESSLFGKGVATGPLVLAPQADGTWRVQLAPTMRFDDQVLAPQPSAVPQSPPSVYNFAKQSWQFRFSADGTYGTHFSSSELFPLTNAHHFTHEAGVAFLQRKTSLTTSADILALRTRFLQRLKADFGVTRIGCVACYDDVPLDGVIDLGGGNHIMAYEVNEAANLRVTGKYIKDGSEKWTPMPQGSRIHEGGFRLLVGRAGLTTAAGHLPFGTLLNEGVYVVEDIGAEWEFSFYPTAPVRSNQWASSIPQYTVHNPVFGEGRVSYAVPMPHPEGPIITHSIHGYMTSTSYDSFTLPKQD